MSLTINLKSFASSGERSLSQSLSTSASIRSFSSSVSIIPGSALASSLPYSCRLILPSAIIFPSPAFLARLGQNKPDVNRLILIPDFDYQSVFVASYVEQRAVPNRVDMGKVAANLAQVQPFRLSGYVVPSVEGLTSVGV